MSSADTLHCHKGLYYVQSKSNFPSFQQITPYSGIIILLYHPPYTTSASLTFTVQLLSSYPKLYNILLKSVSLNNAPNLLLLYTEIIYIYLVVKYLHLMPVCWIHSQQNILKVYCLSVLGWEVLVTLSETALCYTALDITASYCSSSTRWPCIRLSFCLLLGFQSLNFLTTTVAFLDLCILLFVLSSHSVSPIGMLGLYHKTS